MYEELKGLANSDIYPFHMPGHKRQPSKSIFDAAFSFDITEIDGFDNMHHPEGMIRELQERLAEKYHAEEAGILVNGSSSGILTAISAAVRKNSKIIMARNSHKSAYNAAYLRNLEIVYVYPEIISEYEMNGGIDSGDIREALEKNPDAEAVFITSPTYEGVISDVEGIAALCHEYGKALIVDSAHGAHFGLNGDFDRNYGIRSVGDIADICIMSLHKTLPTFTQTALLLSSGNIVNREKLGDFYSIYQTSSPSYLFMAGVDNCLKILEKEGDERFAKLLSKIAEIRDGNYRNIKIIGKEIVGDNAVFAFDESKLPITARGMTGRELYDILRCSYHLQPEMASLRYCLLMTSIMDTEEGFDRLGEALKEIDKTLSTGEFSSEGALFKGNALKEDFIKNETVLRIEEAAEAESEVCDFEKSQGKIAAGWIYAYPPDIPLIVPGERIGREIIDEIRELKENGINMIGIDGFRTVK